MSLFPPPGGNLSDIDSTTPHVLEKETPDATSRLADELFRRIGEAAIQLREAEKKLETFDGFALLTVKDAIRDREEMAAAHWKELASLSAQLEALKRENARLVSQLETMKKP